MGAREYLDMLLEGKGSTAFIVELEDGTVGYIELDPYKRNKHMSVGDDEILGKEHEVRYRNESGGSGYKTGLVKRILNRRVPVLFKHARIVVTKDGYIADDLILGRSEKFKTLERAEKEAGRWDAISRSRY